MEILQYVTGIYGYFSLAQSHISMQTEGREAEERPGARCSAALGEKYEDKTEELAVNKRKCDQCGQHRFCFFFFFFFFILFPLRYLTPGKRKPLKYEPKHSQGRRRTLLVKPIQVLLQQSRCCSSLLSSLLSLQTDKCSCSLFVYPLHLPHTNDDLSALIAIL